MRKGRERSKCDCILLFFEVVIMLQYGESKNLKKKKKIVKLGIVCPELGENIPFGIENGAEIRPQNRVIESPEK